MSDSDQRDPKIVSHATEMGWKDKPEFRGDPELWVDADEYVRRGEQVLPLVKAENRRLQAQQDKLSGEIAKLTAVVIEQRQSMDELVEHSADQLRERLTEQKRQLTAQLRAARKEDDDAAVDAIEEQLEENAEAREKLKTPAAKPAVQAPAAPQTPVETPEYKAWLADNSWFGGTSRVDQAKTAAAQKFGLEMAAAGKRGQAFFDAVNEAMAEVYPKQVRQDPTEEGRPTGGGGGGGGSAKGFAGLPAEAKAKAKEQAAKFVGANKMFKDEKAWFEYYAKQYNTEAA